MKNIIPKFTEYIFESDDIKYVVNSDTKDEAKIIEFIKYNSTNLKLLDIWKYGKTLNTFPHKIVQFTNKCMVTYPCKYYEYHIELEVSKKDINMFLFQSRKLIDSCDYSNEKFQEFIKYRG